MLDKDQIEQWEGAPENPPPRASAGKRDALTLRVEFAPEFRTALDAAVAEVKESATGLDQLRLDHAAWSVATFGDEVGPVGALKHLAKEAHEAAADPGDLSEWADLQFLLWDAQRRAGITDAQLLEAGKAKLAKIRKRVYPQAVDGEPCEHVRGVHD